MNPIQITDLVIVNGNVITVNDNFDPARAVAVKDGVITTVGTDEEIKTLIGPDTRTID